MTDQPTTEQHTDSPATTSSTDQPASLVQGTPHENGVATAKPAAPPAPSSSPVAMSEDRSAPNASPDLPHATSAGPQPPATPEPQASPDDPQPEPQASVTDPQPEPQASSDDPQPEPPASHDYPQPEPQASVADPQPEPQASPDDPQPEPQASPDDPQPEPQASVTDPQPEPQASPDDPQPEPQASPGDPQPLTTAAAPQPAPLPDAQHQPPAAPEGRPEQASAQAAPPSAPAPLPAHPPTVRSALSDPSRWGRVDAEGTVFVRTADGERAVGSWQAGEPAEGLAHFARRFDDVLTEVELIAARLDSGHGDPKQSMTTIRQLRESLDEAHVVGDVVGLAAKLDYLTAKAEQAVGAARQARDAARAESTARKQALVEEAEKIAAEATQWKSAGDRLRAILDEWKTIRGVDRKTDDALWKRFGKARDAFNRRRGSHFAEMDRQRGAAKARKEEIVTEAERLSDSTEWGATAGRYKQLMAEWKAAGRAPKDADDALWQRFRAAQDAFFSRRSSAFTERDSELTDNARRKEQLLSEAERIDPAADLEAARAALHRIQERWDAIGHVPRERMRELENRLRAIEERVRAAGDAQWRRSDPEAQARVDQFRERVEQFETQAAKARAAGDERRARRADEQAAQWREWLAAAEQAVADR